MGFEAVLNAATPSQVPVSLVQKALLASSGHPAKALIVDRWYQKP